MITPDAWQTRAPTIEAYLDEGLRQHMLRVYNYMGLGLVLTGIVAFLGIHPAAAAFSRMGRVKSEDCWIFSAGSHPLRVVF